MDRAPFLDGLRRAAPYATLLGIGLGLVVGLGAQLSHAYPSEARPFGWQGPSGFDNAVGMVRLDIVLATTLPAILAGALILRGLEPRRHRACTLLLVVAGGAAPMALAPTLSALIGLTIASSTKPQAFWVFAITHGLLSLAFYALGVLAASLAPRAGTVPAGLAAWASFVIIYEKLVNWRVFREAGYARLRVGDFPDWYYVAQALNPLTAYRGMLITWRPEFRNGMEKAVLKGATLPPWMHPLTFGTLLILLWIALPTGLAAAAWMWRGRRARDPQRARSPTWGAP